MVRDLQCTEFSPQIFSCVAIVIKPSVGLASVRYEGMMLEMLEYHSIIGKGERSYNS